jgi:diadenosine tetraphosphate (Ap4A) HIT family hydrolase
MNATIERFGGATTLVADYPHWVVLLRPQAVTLGSLIIAAKSEATAFSTLPEPAFTELARVIRDVETTLAAAVGQARMNYLMLMMVDPHVHFHALPRYDGSRRHDRLAIADSGWPGPPDLAGATGLTDGQIVAQRSWLKALWPAGGRQAD